MVKMTPTDVEAGDRHHLVCRECHLDGHFVAFDTYAEYHKHYREEHIDGHG